jgi:hypothetical protein
VENVEYFTYLGNMVTKIKSRITMAKAEFNRKKTGEAPANWT